MTFKALQTVVSLQTIVFRFAVAFAFVSAFYNGWAQRPLGSTASVEKWFDSVTGTENSGLINGQQYRMTFIGRTSNPFFEESEAQGTVLFKGQQYNATLLYDEFQDVLVVKHFTPSGNVWFVQLDKKFAKEFSIHEKLFRIFNGSYYQVIFDSQNIKVLAKRIKLQTVNRTVLDYAVHDELYVVQSGRWSRFKTLSELTKVVLEKEDRDNVRIFIKENRIRNRKFSDENVSKVAAYVNSIRDLKHYP